MDSLSSVRTFIHDYSACCERALDVCGYLPLISKTSGLLRFKFAIVQLILSISCEIFHLISKTYDKFYPLNISLYPLEWLAIDLIHSSIKNSVRALVEMLFLANLSLIIYDYLKTQELDWSLNSTQARSHALDWPLLYQIFPIHKKGLISDQRSRFS